MWTDARDPHHCCRRVSDHAPGAARVRGSDDGSQVADMHLCSKQRVRHRAADQGSRYVVEKAGEHEDDNEKPERPLPVMRKNAWEGCRYTSLLEMARQQPEYNEQEEQVRQDHPFVSEMGN